LNERLGLMFFQVLSEAAVTGGAAFTRPGVLANVSDRAKAEGDQSLQQGFLGHLEAMANHSSRASTAIRAWARDVHGSDPGGWKAGCD